MGEHQLFIFWYYLAAAIQSRLNAMHDCLLDAHNAFISAAGPLPDRLAKARTDLAACRKDSHWDSLSYTYAGANSATANGPPVTVSISDWDDFKTCLEDYAYDLDMSARLEARAVRTERSWSFSRPAWRTQVCRDTDVSCLQDAFLSQLPAALAKSCGNYDKGYL